MPRIRLTGAGAAVERRSSAGATIEIMASGLSRDGWSVEDYCAPADRDFLSDRLNEFNVEATGMTDGRELAIIVKDDQSSIIAGLYGWTWGGFCEIETLWVHAHHRGRGLGTKLLLAAEDEARVRGARQVALDTHTFQAPDFYLAKGYSVIGKHDDYPIGHSHLLLSKRLVDD
jgi:GNAT superfamily N-acetyltransferase